MITEKSYKGGDIDKAISFCVLMLERLSEAKKQRQYVRLRPCGLEKHDMMDSADSDLIEIKGTFDIVSKLFKRGESYRLEYDIFETEEVKLKNMKSASVDNKVDNVVEEKQ
jgi:hypothetical protein